MEDNNNPNAGKLFTQEDVNRIVQERLSKERSKGNAEMEAALAQREKDLQAREFIMTAKESISQAGLPAEMFDVLDKSSPEAFQKALVAASGMMKKKEEASAPPAAIPQFTRQMTNNGSGKAFDHFRDAFGLKQKG